MFGLDLQLLKLKGLNSTNSFSTDFITKNYYPSAQQVDGSVASPRSNYEKLHLNNKNTIETILFLMDKFGVGDELFIHKLSIAIDPFPVKSYLIKQCRSDLNKQVKISTTSGLAPGTQYSFKALLTDKVRDMVRAHYWIGFN